MRKIYSKIKNFLGFFGINPTAGINNLRGLPLYWRDLKELKKQKGNNTDFPFGKPFMMLRDRYAKAGTLSGQYFHQDLYVARKIYEANPIKHIDIDSSLNSFVAHVAVFREIEVFDVRPQESKVKNIQFKQADMMQMPEGFENYCDSISALHSIEHFGLGRYGDPVDYFGHLKALENIFKIIKPGGTFYFSVPIGPQRIEFNGHRVFSVKYLIENLSKLFTINDFSYIDDKGDFYESPGLIEDNVTRNFNCTFGIGIFILSKK